MISFLAALLSRNALAIAAIAGLVAWAHLGIKQHDQKVARAAVAEVKDEARAKVQVAKKAQRRVDPAAADGVLERRYCSDCAAR